MTPGYCWEKVVYVGDKEKIVSFSQSIGDNNYLHRSGKIIVPGVMIIGFISASIAEKIPGVKVWELKQVKFRSPVPPDALLLISCSVVWVRKRLVKVAVSVKNENGKADVVTGSCVIVLPL